MKCEIASLALCWKQKWGKEDEIRRLNLEELIGHSYSLQSIEVTSSRAR